jgi:hypothetical protein
MKNIFGRLMVILAVTSIFMACVQPTSIKSSDATLSSMSVTGYSLDKTFASDVTAYTAVVEKTVSSVTITATANDSKASVSWDKNPANTTLSTGPNVFTVTVTAEDGTTKSYTITIYRANATVEVIDSVNGSKLAAGGNIYIYSNGSLLYSAVFSTNPQPIWLGEGSTYTVKASPTGRAQSSKEGVIGVNDLALTMICQKLDMSTFPAESPTIDSITYTTASDPTSESTVWNTLSSGSSVDFSTMKYIKVVATGKAEMDATSWAGFGIEMGLDQTPSTFSGIAADETLSTSSYNSTAGTFTGTAYFATSWTNITSGAHTISFVIYDRANNRTEKNLTVTNTLANTSGSDISAYYFQSLSADLRIYGVSREYFKTKKSTDSLTGLSSGSISYRAAISFKFQTASSGGSAVPILGFTVYRSEDSGATWEAVGTVNYGALSTGTSGTHTFYDTDSQLTEGVEYKYKVTVFTDDTHTNTSGIMGPVKFLPAFTASLVAPANKSPAIDATDLPNFTFTISDSSLWNTSVSDRFYFSPVIRKADGTYAYVGYFYYKFSTNQLCFEYPGNNNWYAYNTATTASLISFDSSTGTISLSPSIFNADTNYATGADLALDSGVTYYWDIFGNYTGSSSTNTAAYFYKSGTNCISRSYADVYQNGQETLNGWFSFTVE